MTDPASHRHRVVVVTGGHPFEAAPFFEVFDANPAIEWRHVAHPEAVDVFTPEAAADVDCFVLYDMPGLRFGRGGTPELVRPPDRFVTGFDELTARGQPFVVLHHAAAAWPAWPRWAQVIGARFLYRPVSTPGGEMPDSGYVFDVRHTVTPVADHPVTAGIDPFELIDELYLWSVDEAAVTPLLRSDFDFVDSNFFSAARAVAGDRNDRTGWRHPRGSDLIGWTTRCARSPIVYLQPGDGPVAHGHPGYRRLLANAIDWACSNEARAT